MVTTLLSGEDALEAVSRDRPHLIMLDWEYPGIVAARLIHHIQREIPTQRARLMALSLFSGEQHVVAGFEQGIDDYVWRPYSVPVLMARVRAVLRTMHVAIQEPDLLKFQRLRIDLADHRVMVEEHIVPLRPIEFRLLAFLVRNPERVFTREQLLTRVWGRDCEADERAVDVTVQRTRKALACHGGGHYLQTVRAFGYRLSAVHA
jgi:two-component system phosphate regulon response regulator PhoB